LVNTCSPVTEIFPLLVMVLAITIFLFVHRGSTSRQNRRGPKSDSGIKIEFIIYLFIFLFVQINFPSHKAVARQRNDHIGLAVIYFLDRKYPKKLRLDSAKMALQE
jgi:hypothetical protein